jgi:hypothetical protein
MVVNEEDPNRPEDVLKVDADENGVGGDDTSTWRRSARCSATKMRELWSVWQQFQDLVPNG